MEKEKRSLSGIFFRYQNPETNIWENWCFEDLPLNIQKKIMDLHDLDWLKGMIIALSDSLNEVGGKFDLVKE